MIFRHQGGAKSRPSSEPPSLQSPLRCETPKTPSDESKDKKWFRGIFKKKGYHPKVWATTSLGGVGDMLPPPPPSPSPPPSQLELDGVEQKIQDVDNDPVGDIVTNRCEMKNSHQDSRPPAVHSEGSETISDAVEGDKRISEGHATRDFACGAARREENHDRAKARDTSVRCGITRPIAAKRTSELQEQPCSGKQAAPRAATTAEKLGAKGEAALPQRASSQTLQRRSTRVDSGIADAPVKLILPPRLSVEAADETREGGGEFVRMEVGGDGTSKRTGDARHSGTNPEENNRVALPGNTGPWKKTVTVGMSVLCLEMRSSVDGVSAIRRWREAEIAEVYPGESNAVFAKVMFWETEAGSVSLRLKEDWERLAIPGSLTREEMEMGAPLEGDALATSRKVFKPRSRNRGRPRASGERTRDKLSPGSHRRSTSVPLSGADGGTLVHSSARRTLTLGASESFEDMQKQVAAGSVSVLTRRRTADSGADSSPARPRSGVVVPGSEKEKASGGSSRTSRSRSPRRYSTPPSLAHGHSRRSSTGRMAAAVRSPLRCRDSRKGNGASGRAGNKASVRRTESDASGRSGSSSRRRWQFEEERRSSTTRHVMAGDRIDCLDFYVSSQSGQEKREWREAEVLKVEYKRRSNEEEELRILVHFIMWSSKWDTWISCDREPERLAPHLSKARPASERLRADGTAVNQGLPSAQSYPPRTRTGSNSTSSTATPTVTTVSSSSTSGETGRSSGRGYLSDGQGEASTRSRRASSRGQGDRAAKGDPTGSQRKGGGVRRPRSPGGKLTVTGDVISTGSSTVTSGGCSNSPVTSEVDSVGSSDSLFREAMRRKGLSVVDVEPDGNCLFRSVSHQIYGDADRHNQVRKACVDHMSKHKSRFGVFVAEDFRDYLYRIRQTGVWGDDLEIRALEELFDRPIEIYSSEAEDLRPMKIDFDASELDLDAKPIKLSYHGQSHYNSVRDKKLSYPLHPLRTKNILHIRQAQHARTPRSASVSRAGGGRAGEGPAPEVFARRSARRSRFRGLRDPSPFSHGASKKAGSAFRNLIAGFSSKVM